MKASASGALHQKLQEALNARLLLTTIRNQGQWLHAASTFKIKQGDVLSIMRMPQQRLEARCGSNDNHT